ncbi:DUF4153 domain-containing protein [Sphingomonas crusticola]|uniref:DUF4153 domain-containing protein n=1 Tax=Sphingomonas crusticola TaxID=1697973 RepID=UPI000E23122F|nr:DUF4173 domain-containing protein [Sphingomonas crusticola]
MHSPGGRYSFVRKFGVTILLVALFDRLFPDIVDGVGMGVFALAWLIGLIAVRPAVRRQQAAFVALGAALLFILSLTYDPGVLAWAMFWCALSVAALLPRTAGFDDAWRWAARLLLHAGSGLVAPLADLHRLFYRRPRERRLTMRSVAALLAMPLVGTAIFIALFANANPLIADLLSRIRLPSIDQIWAWTIATLCVWPAMRPRALATRLARRLPEPGLQLPGSSLPSVLIALVLFNALFALQNGLDIAFLWSGAALPAGTTMPDYVHRGAYPLIFTALLAGFLVLTMLRPGTASADNKPARWLVALWVAQNIFLVASSVLRTIEYIESYMLTAWRIAALAWMALVAVGLILILWRMLSGRSARWLINANALAASIVLLPCCFIDLGATAATWNVRHAREAGGTGQSLDLCYLSSLGDAALLPIIEMAQRPVPAELRDQLDYLREKRFNDLAKRQSDWRTWTPHGAMRLHRVQRLLDFSTPARLPAPGERDFCGALVKKPAPALPLTATPAR